MNLWIGRPKKTLASGSAGVVVIAAFASAALAQHISQHASERTMASRAYWTWPRADFAASPPPCQGGANCLITKQFAVELQLRPYGKIKAWVRDRVSHKLVYEDTLLQAKVPTQSGARGVELRWLPNKQYFAGFLPQSVRPSSGVAQISLTQRGKVQRASAPISVVPHPMQGGVVIAAGRYAFEVIPYAQGNIEVIPVGFVEKASQLKLSVTALGRDKKVLLIPLKYSQTHKRFLGRVPEEQGLVTGPIDLEVRDGRTEYHSGVVAAKPLPNSDWEGWQMIVGPYTMEVAKIPGGKLAAIVRDANNLAVSSPTIELEMNLHVRPESEGSQNITTVPLKWNIHKLRFEGVVPTVAQQFVWLDVEIHPLAENKDAEIEVEWRGSTRW